MSAERAAGAGEATATGGSPFPVDFSADRQARLGWLVFLGGPLLWLAHFGVVYLVAEAGCTGDGPGLDVFDPPVPRTFTLVATVVATAGCVPLAVWALRRWRTESAAPSAGEGALGGRAGDGGGRGGLAFAGYLLSLVSLVSILFVGLPAAFLPAC